MILTRSQGERLAVIINAARPEWTIPSISKILQKANQGNGLPAHDFNHAIRAAVAYATAANSAGYVKQTPGFIHEPSHFWDDTAPNGTGYQSAPPVWCEEHPDFEAHSCKCCWSDVKTGVRDESQIGKRMVWADDTPPGEPRMTIAEAKEQMKMMQATRNGGFTHAQGGEHDRPAI